MLAVAVLAAGKGTRMRSALPKVLQPLAGASLVERVLASCDQLQPERRLLIVGHQAERVEQSLAGHAGLEFVLQQPQNGTGHAVQQLLEPLADFSGDLLVLNGDVPLLRPKTLVALLEQHPALWQDRELLMALVRAARAGARPDLAAQWATRLLQVSAVGASRQRPRALAGACATAHDLRLGRRIR